MREVKQIKRSKKVSKKTARKARKKARRSNITTSGGPRKGN